MYEPLEKVTVFVKARGEGDSECRVEVRDPFQRLYYNETCKLSGNRGKIQFHAAGALGTHYIYLFWPGENRHSRYFNFILDARTGIETGDSDFDELYPRTRQLMPLGRREYDTEKGRIVGYISADTWHFDGIWLRDWIYGLPAYKHWEEDMFSGLDRFLEAQDQSGMIPDGIERSGKTWRVGLESDVEYILVMGVWQSWQATGDHEWLRRAIPRLEKAIGYVRGSPHHWDSANGLVKRQHSCDTWDFDIDGAGNSGGRRLVIAACDQSGYYLAFKALAKMHACLGHAEAAKKWRKLAGDYRRRARKLLWGANKFLHHVHLEEIDHGGFEEEKQLAMGNTWAITRGLAAPWQARRIIDEYRRRHEETGDAYPWWSLQPGYPDYLGYFHEPFRKQGGYANGGLMPWVGGELCHGAFLSGRESYGVELLRNYMRHLRKTGGVQVWYWPNGEPGFRTRNEVPYAGWGMAQWAEALIGGLAGITDESFLYDSVRVSPRWAAAGIKRARAAARYGASGGYFAYSMRMLPRGKEIKIDYCGSGRAAKFEILLPPNRTGREVILKNRRVSFKHRVVDGSRYVLFKAPIEGASFASIKLAPA